MQRWRSGRTRTTRNRVYPHKGNKGSNPFLCAKPRIRAHLAPFLPVSGFGHLRFSKLPCPRIGKDAICNPSARFEGDHFYPRNPCVNNTSSFAEFVLFFCLAMSCKCAEAGARRVLVRKIISPIRGFACAIRMIEPIFPASPIFYINFEKTRLKLWQKKKKTTIFCGQADTPGGNRKERRTPRRNSDRSPKARSRPVISAVPAGGQKRQGMREHALRNGTPGGNRTHNGPLGGGCYIHLTTEAYSGSKRRRVLPAPPVRRAGTGAPFFYYTILLRKKQ